MQAAAVAAAAVGAGAEVVVHAPALAGLAPLPLLVLDEEALPVHLQIALLLLAHLASECHGTDLIALCLRHALVIRPVDVVLHLLELWELLASGVYHLCLLFPEFLHACCHQQLLLLGLAQGYVGLHLTGAVVRIIGWVLDLAAWLAVHRVRSCGGGTVVGPLQP